MKEDLQTKAAEMMKRVLTVGMGAFFLTEESLRGLVADFKLPKEFLVAILESANKTKDEVFRNISKEMMSQVMERVDPVALIQELLAKNEIDLKIQMSFRPKKKSEP